jgi:hypothetical protein
MTSEPTLPEPAQPATPLADLEKVRQTLVEMRLPDLDPDAINAAWRQFAQALQPWIDLCSAAWAQLQSQLEASGLTIDDLTALRDIEPTAPCICLCGQHRADGMFCTGEASQVIRIHNDTRSVDVKMCQPCGDWRLRWRPDTNTQVRNLQQGTVPAANE